MRDERERLQGTRGTRTKRRQGQSHLPVIRIVDENEMKQICEAQTPDVDDGSKVEQHAQANTSVRRT